MDELCDLGQVPWPLSLSCLTCNMGATVQSHTMKAHRETPDMVTVTVDKQQQNTPLVTLYPKEVNTWNLVLADKNQDVHLYCFYLYMRFWSARVQTQDLLDARGAIWHGAASPAQQPGSITNVLIKSQTWDSCFKHLTVLKPFLF